MADHETWVKRVAEWKASGLTSTAFCEGKDFTPGGLRRRAHRLGGDREQRRASVRIARVVRLPTARSSSRVEPAPTPEAPAIVIEFGGARVTVRSGVDRTTLATVVEVLTAAAPARSER
jgi:hypothetical protein